MFSANLRRIMARQGLTIDQVVERTGLDERTVKSILADGGTRPRARTLHQLSGGLGVSADELFQNPSTVAQRLFDRQTNPLVDDVVREHPRLFDGWTANDFDELYSRFGHGGALTAEGTLDVVSAMNRRRQVHCRVALVLETCEAEVLCRIVDVLYEKVTLRAPVAERLPTPAALSPP